MLGKKKSAVLSKPSFSTTLKKINISKVFDIDSANWLLEKIKEE